MADVSQSNAPKELSSFKTPGIARDVVVSGLYAYVADDWKGICIIDITGTPFCLKSVETAGRIYGVAVDQKYLYAADADNGIRAFDIANPAKTVEIAESQVGGRMTKVVVGGGKAYCADSKKGILCYDLSDPKQLKLTASHDLLSQDGSIQIVVKDRYAYAACGVSGFSVIDMEDPCNPVIAAHLDFSEAVSSIRLNEGYAYLFSRNRIFTVSVSDPTNPVCLSETIFRTDDFPQSIDMDSNFLYIACGNNLQILSIKDPSRPIIVSAHILSVSPEALRVTGIAVRNEIAYISAGYQGIFLYEVSDFDKIKYLSTYTNGKKNYEGMDFCGNLAFPQRKIRRKFWTYRTSESRNTSGLWTVSHQAGRTAA